MPFELAFTGTSRTPIGRSFAGPIEPQFPVGTAFPLEVGKRVVLGRAKDCAILVDSMIAQRHHVAVTLGRDETLLVENLGGGSQMFSRGKYIDDRVTLSPGGQFELGGVLVFEFRPA
jgi:FHA domain-containing protein